MTSTKKLIEFAKQRAVEPAHRSWYAEAAINTQTFLAEYAPLCLRPGGPQIEEFFAVLAVLSPRVSVAQNIRRAVRAYMLGVRPRTTKSVLTSFTRLWDSGFDPDAIKGPKTRPFYDALLGDPDALVLDVHMGYILGVPQQKLRNLSVVREARRRLKRVGKEIGLSVRDTQAHLWGVQRYVAGYQPAGISLDLLIDSLFEEVRQTLGTQCDLLYPHD